ncbi:MAG TPA: redoxin domain-containing protein [Pirellulales bacterium]|nr:redoxin domain-containing protein [Pirellulales bacterium]
MLRYLATLLVLTLCAPTLASEPLADFALPDCHGRTHRLSDYADSKLVVVAVLGTECPLAKLYGTRLAALSAEYEPRGVTFLGLNANRQDTLAEIAAHAKAHEIAFPVLKDQPQKSTQPGEDAEFVVDRLGAERTPEVFVLDAKRVVRYHGRVDDQYAPGIVRPEPTRRDLALAIDELLAGKDVTQPTTEVIGCHIGREPKIAAIADAPVTYCNQIARLFNGRCVNCHRPGEIAPFSLESYDDAVSWAETILEVVDQQRMPPWLAGPKSLHFKNEAKLSDTDKQAIHDWIDDGCPEGDRSQLPEPPKFTEGWQIPEPDEIYYIADEPIQVPAEGEVKYQYFVVDPHWTEDKWVQFAEARPDNRSVVHHIVVNFRKPEAGGGRRGAGSSAEGGLVGYAPGLPPSSYPPNTALRVPAGSKLVFQMHYTPNGRPQQDRSYVGFKFIEPAEVTTRIQGGVIGSHQFIIPAGDSNHEVTAEVTSPVDLKLLTLTPHMHLRGKSFRYEAVFPDGERKILLDVPRWDFNWQLRYDLAEPIVLPKGTKVICTAHYDNSEHNPSNPDPSVTVRWGDQTWEEMMLGYFTAVRADGENESLGRIRAKTWWEQLRDAFRSNGAE